MSAFQNHRDKIEMYEFQLGTTRGRLAAALDVLTDALFLVGQHAVYCRNSRRPELPKMDIQAIMRGIDESKELIISVMEELKRQKEAERLQS